MPCIRWVTAALRTSARAKYFELELAADSSEKARAMASEVADKLLANPVIESYRIEIDGASR